MENTVLDELLNLFLNDEQEVDGRLPNPPDVVKLPDDVPFTSDVTAVEITSVDTYPLEAAFGVDGNPNAT